MIRMQHLLLIILGISLIACDKDTGLNLFTLRQDIEFGETMDSAIKADPAEFPILDAVEYAEAYAFINDMMQDILVSDDFVHKDDFHWEITLIDKDVMNAFAVPGGRMYFYTGLMKYLENSANLAGILAHEMAHIDRRHSTEQLTKKYGLDVLLTLLTGKNKSKWGEIAVDLASGLSSLQFSRDHEYEADEYSVRFMADTDYDPRGIAGFFRKLENDGHTNETFEFLSTHPSDEKRLENMNTIWENEGSPGGGTFTSEYENFKNNMLP